MDTRGSEEKKVSKWTLRKVERKLWEKLKLV